jgi:hypothetical protein
LAYDFGDPSGKVKRAMRIVQSCESFSMFMFDVQQLRGSIKKLSHSVLSPPPHQLCRIIHPVITCFSLPKQICCRSNSRQTAGRAPRNGLWPNQFICNWKFSPKATGARSERAPTQYFFILLLSFPFVLVEFLEVREEKLDLWNVLSLETCCFAVDPKRKLEISYDFVDLH